MTHLALYRKYRPTGFDSLIGQEAIKTTLLNALETNKTSHAYLFSGPRGTGKTSSAKILAKALNCLKPNGVEPCGTCDSCKDSNPDIIEMDAASNNGVDEIRELREKVVFAPLYGRYKVYIIDEVHMLTTPAFNALLKTLEEPPAHAVFILATTEPHKIPLTILSRCQRYDFRRISVDDIILRMEVIVEAEKAKVETEALQLIAQIAAGGMRDALSLLDQAISNANGPVTLQSVIDLTGAVDTRKIGKLIETISTNQVEESLEHFNNCFQSGQEPKFFVEEMMIYLRDILLYEKLGNHATLKKGLTDPDFQQVAKSISSDRIYLYLELLQNTMEKMKFHHDIQLLMEMTIVKMIHGEENRLQIQIDELKQLIQNGVSSNISNKESKGEVLQETAPIAETPITKTIEEVASTKVESTIPKTEFLSTFTIEDLGEITSSVAITEEIAPEDTSPLAEETLISTTDEEPPFQPSIKEGKLFDGAMEENSFIALAEESYRNGEEWVEYIEEPEELQQQVEESTEISKGQDDSTLEPTQVLLSTDEENALQILKTCTKEAKSDFASEYDKFHAELTKANLSTAVLFREFKVKAVSDKKIILSHKENAKVLLMKKVKNKSIIESLLGEIYQPLTLEVINENEWENILIAYKEIN